MNLGQAGRAARNIGYISWSFEKVLKLLRFMGRKTYSVLTDKITYNVEISILNQPIEMRESLSTKDINDILKAMRTLDHVTLTIRRFKP